MKFTPDQMASRVKQNISYKHGDDSGPACRAMGDCPANSNTNCYARSIDPVNCWGDVPKRPTRFIDLLNEGAQGISGPSVRRSTVSRANPEQYSISDSHKTPNIDDNRNDSTAAAVSGSCPPNNNNNNKSTGTTGRERLLEWLRTSQAKRDENNRQVFTRWIDKLEAMNNQLMTSASLSQSNVSVIEPSHSTEFQANSLFQFPPTMSGPMTTPAVWIANPMGLMTTATIPTAVSNLKGPNPLPTNLPNAYLPPVFPIKSSIFGCPAFPQNFPSPPINMPSAPSEIEACNGELQSETSRFTSEPVKPELFSQHCLNSAHLTPRSDESGEDLKQFSENPSVLACDEVNITQNGTFDLKPKSFIKNNLVQQFPSMNSGSALFNGGVDGGSYLSQPLFITTSTLCDPSCPQFLYYCYIPNQLAQQTGHQSLPYSMQPQTFEKFPGLGQPLIYMLQTNNRSTLPQTPTVNQLYYTPEVGKFESTVLSENGIAIRQPDHCSDQTGGPFSSLNRPSSDDQCGRPNSFSTTEAELQPSEEVAGVDDRLNRDQPLDLNMVNRPQASLDFNLHKWYSALDGITQSSLTTE